MKKITTFITILILITFVLSGCEAIGTIFKAGVWSGVIIVVFIVFLLLIIINKSSNKK